MPRLLGGADHLQSTGDDDQLRRLRSDPRYADGGKAKLRGELIRPTSS